LKGKVDTYHEEYAEPAYTFPKAAILRTLHLKPAVPMILPKPVTIRSTARMICAACSTSVVLSALEERVRFAVPETVDWVEVVPEAVESTTLPTNVEPEGKVVVEEPVVLKSPTPEPVPQEQPIEPTASKSDVPTTAITDIVTKVEPVESSAPPADNSSPIATASQGKAKLAEVAVKPILLPGNEQSAEKTDAEADNSSDAPAPETEPCELEAPAAHLESGVPLACDSEVAGPCRAEPLNESVERDKKAMPLELAASSTPIAVVEPTKNLPGPCESSIGAI
jgi:hypothetical protein